MSSKKPSTFSKVTKVVVWIMLIAIVGSSILAALSVLFR